MKPATDIPMTISDEAAEYIAQADLQGALELILAHIRETAPAVQCIRVILEWDYTCHRDYLFVEAVVPDPSVDLDALRFSWFCWMTEAILREKCVQFMVHPARE